LNMNIFLFCALICASARLQGGTTNDPVWETYKKTWHKIYRTTEEEAKRHSLFNESLKRVADLNTKARRAGREEVFGQTRFSDWTPEEFSVRLGRKSSVPTHKNVNASNVFEYSPALHTGDITKTVDWRTTPGVVSHVKDQGQCGSCWAFSVAETVESATVLQAGSAPMEYSPQQIAANTPEMFGCGGGDTPNAYEYLMNEKLNPAGGLASEWYCPYSQSMVFPCQDNTCTNQCSGSSQWSVYATSFPVAQLSGYKFTTPACLSGACASQDLEKLRQGLATYGPTSVCVNAGAWNDYTGGILSDVACGGHAAYDIDHCVQLVGYHEDAQNSNNSYWLVRNSWSTNWGEDGYIRLQFDANTCGLANEASIPIIKQTEP